MSQARSGFQAATRRVTIGDVAREAGVSLMTVSRALRGEGRLSTETRARVKAVADRLGYVPNRLAGNLSSQTGTVVGVVVPSIGAQVFAEILAGINSVLRPQGLQTFIGETDFDEAQENEVLRTLLSLQPAALVLTGGIARSANTRQLLAARVCPAVNIWDGDHPDLDATVGIRHRDVGRLVGGQLLALGHRDIAYVGSQTGRDLCAGMRLDGLRERLAEAGQPLVEVTDPDLPRDDITGYLLTARLLEAGLPVGAIHYLNDVMALGGLRRLREAGIAVPGRVAVTGFNGTSSAYAVETRLTTMTLDRFGMGVRAGLAILGLRDGSGTDPLCLVEPQFLPGNTT